VRRQRWSYFQTVWFTSVLAQFVDLEELTAERGIIRGSHKHLAVDADLWSGGLTAARRRGQAEILHLPHGRDVRAHRRPVDVIVPRVDSQGQTVDFYLSETRDREAAKLFLKKALASPDNRLPFENCRAKVSCTVAVQPFQMESFSFNSSGPSPATECCGEQTLR
jgi:hypothetical protein